MIYFKEIFSTCNLSVICYLPLNHGLSNLLDPPQEVFSTATTIKELD